MCLTALVAAMAAPAAADESLSSGILTARISDDPWGLTLLESRRGAILSEAAGTGIGPVGTLGFKTPAGWFHATRITEDARQGGAYEATLATTDPGRSIVVRFERAGEGSLRMAARVEGPAIEDVLSMGIAFEAGASERFLGFGEHSDAVDQRGRVVTNHVYDGPYQAEERPVVAAFIPPWGLGPDNGSTYFPMPWLLSTSGYGVLIENPETSRHRLGSDDPGAWSLEVDAKWLGLRYFAGPRPVDVLRRLTRHLGRQPPPAAPWFLGPWYQPTADELPQARQLRRLDVPASAANTYLHYLPCGDQQGHEAEQPARTRGFHAAGYAVTTYFNPMICEDYGAVYDRAADEGLLTKNALGQPYSYRYGADFGELMFVGQIDFSAPGADAFFGDLLAEAVGHGYDGWMEDFGEYSPPDAVSHNGMSGDAMHNLYPVLYHRSSHRFARTQSRPVAGFIRSGWTGVHPYAQLVWGGDPTVDWGFDGLASAVKQGLSIGLSGISRWGSDIGGFFANGSRRLTPELLIRWIEFGAVSGVMRTEANGVAVPDKPRAQITDPDVLPIWRRYAKLRTQLYPYLSAAEARYSRSGLPLMRHLALAYPRDPRAIAREDEFLFGPDLLAAPVLEPGARQRSLYAPVGRWIDLWRAVSYLPGTGGLRLGSARTIGGGRTITVPAPLNQLPLLVRAGAILPLLPSGVDTLAAYGGDAVVNLRDRERRLVLLAFPHGRSSAALGSKGLARSNEVKGRWRLRLFGVRGRRVRLQASLATLLNELTPCLVRLNSHALKRGRGWRFDEDEEVVRARFRARRKVNVLTVLGPSRCGQLGPGRARH